MNEGPREEETCKRVMHSGEWVYYIHKQVSIYWRFVKNNGQGDKKTTVARKQDSHLRPILSLQTLKRSQNLERELSDRVVIQTIKSAV